jgi:drug/metabolite transporter (DMT)-like permease
MFGELFGALVSLVSAMVWGSGDFFGGLASRKVNSLHVAVFGGAVGLAMLTLLAMVYGEGLPDARSAQFGVVAGLCGLLGLASLYQGLSLGVSSVVASISTVLAQALPVAYAAVLYGLPGPLQLAGFALAVIGCLLVTRTGSGDAAAVATGVRYGVLSGIGFGGFLICIAETASAHVFGSLAVARVALVATALLVLTLVRRERLERAAASVAAAAAGLLDAGGNVLFLVARQFARLDVVVVLGSLYPIATILLSRFVLKERIAPVQWAGIVVCGVAVGMIVA